MNKFKAPLHAFLPTSFRGTFEKCTYNNSFLLSTCPLFSNQVDNMVSIKIFKRLLTTKACAENLVVTSPQNPKVKLARALLKKKSRDEENRFLLEGQSRIIHDALQAGVEIDTLFYTTEALSRTSYGMKIQQYVNSKDNKIRSICTTEKIIRLISDTENPQGIVAIAHTPCHKRPKNETFLLICDEIRDPGNLGNILRTAAGVGIDSVLLSSGCADPWSLKTIRSAMGAHFWLKVNYGMTIEEIIDYTRECNCDIKIADGSGTSMYYQVDWKKPVALVIGSESVGPSPLIRSNASDIVQIPLKLGQMESLNAATAGAILMYEVYRQRNS